MMKKFVFFLILFFVFLILIVLNTTPIRVPAEIAPWLHFGGFFIITGIISLFYMILSNMKYLNYYIFFMFIFGSITAGIVEKIQDITPHRNSCEIDWLMNIAGMTLCLLLLYIYSLWEKS